MKATFFKRFGFPTMHKMTMQDRVAAHRRVKFIVYFKMTNVKRNQKSKIYKNFKDCKKMSKCPKLSKLLIEEKSLNKTITEGDQRAVLIGL